jgi:hypothetical protein
VEEYLQRNQLTSLVRACASILAFAWNGVIVEDSSACLPYVC